MSEAGDSIDESPAPEALEPQPDPPKPYPGFWQAISILLGYVVLQIVFIIPFFIADAVWKGNYSKHPIALLTAIVGPGSIIILSVCWHQRIPFATLAGGWPGAFVLAPLLTTVVGLLCAEVPVIVWVGRSAVPITSGIGFSRLWIESIARVGVPGHCRRCPTD